MAAGTSIVVRLNPKGDTPVILQPAISGNGTQNANIVECWLEKESIERRFPKSLLFFPAAREETGETKAQQSSEEAWIFRLTGEELETKLCSAITQLFRRIPYRRAEMAKANDDFACAEKARRSEQERTVYRAHTRYNFPKPALRLQSPLLCPSDTLNQDARRTIRWKHGRDPKEKKEKDYKMHRYSASETMSLPNSIMKRDIPQMYDPKWFTWVSLKSNGLRFYLLIATFYGQTMVLLRNRAGDFFLIKGLPVPEKLSKGCLFDGELVQTKDGKFAFLVFDCAMVSGIICGEEVYSNRMQFASLAIEGWGKQLARAEKKEDVKGSGGTNSVVLPRFEIRIKPFCMIENVPDLLTLYLPQTDYKTDGLILMANEPPILSGRSLHGESYKFKRGTDNTIDFLIACNEQDCRNGVCSLISFEKTTHGQKRRLWGLVYPCVVESPYSVAHRLGIQLALSLPPPLAVYTLLKALNGKVAECRYDIQRTTWVLELLRTDKGAPNQLSTAMKTWSNIQENLTLQDVFPQGSMSETKRDRLKAWEARFATWEMASDLAGSPRPSLKTRLHESKVDEVSDDFEMLQNSMKLADMRKTDFLFPLSVNHLSRF